MRHAEGADPRFGIAVMRSGRSPSVAAGFQAGVFESFGAQVRFGSRWRGVRSVPE